MGLRPPCFTAAFHRSDSGTKKMMKTANTAGLAPTSIIHRQSVSVTSRISATTAMNSNPTLQAAPMMPANFGRCRSGQHSTTKATASDHSPPMPSDARNRNTPSCQGDVTK